MKHIKFEAIDCKKLSYIKESNAWMCTNTFSILGNCDVCMRCKFSKLRRNEVYIKHGVY